MESVKRAVRAVLCLAVCAGWCGIAFASPDRGTELFRLFLRGFSPERAQMKLYKQPTEDGYIPMFFITMKGAHVQGMRVERATMMAYELKVTPPAHWKDAQRPEVLGFLSCNARATVLEKDVNDFLRARSFQDGRWSDGSVVFEKDNMKASLLLKVDLKFFRTTVRLNMDTAFDVVDGSQIWLNLKSFDVNGYPVPTYIVKEAVRGLQPILDLKKFGLPIRLSRIVLEPRVASVQSLWTPRPVSGLVWYWDGRKIIRQK